MSSFELNLPLRGRWLRYFLFGGAAPVLWFLSWFLGWDRFATLLSSRPGSPSGGLSTIWGLGEISGWSSLGVTGWWFRVGPFYMIWTTDDSYQSWAETFVRQYWDAGFLAVTLVSIAFCLLHHYRRNPTRQAQLA
jgi:hypothetical protein